MKHAKPVFDALMLLILLFTVTSMAGIVGCGDSGENSPSMPSTLRPSMSEESSPEEVKDEKPEPESDTAPELTDTNIQSIPDTDDEQDRCSETSLISFILKEGDDRMMKIECKDGSTFEHRYTSDRQYICPDGTVVQESTGIALIVNNVIYVDSGSFLGALWADGVQVDEWYTHHCTPDILHKDCTAWKNYKLSNEGISLIWSWDELDFIELDGQSTKLAGQTFQEYADRVAYYDEGPRYVDRDPFLPFGGETYDNMVVFIPIEDFVEPFGYRVVICDDMVSILK